jgi:peptidoglycan/LPS O-acetylase OafA/YrhL
MVHEERLGMADVLAAPSGRHRRSSTAGSTRVGRRRAPAKRGFRPDIEGFRAVAVLAVLIYHAGVPFLPGGFVGVDVFFVISGFLITGLIHAELDRTGRLRVGRFYARRIRRLLPAATLVLVVTAIASVLILSPLRREEAGRDITSAAWYFANWRFAGQETDYFTADSAPSPVLHFWSLAVEEQFYVVWPFLLIAAALLARRAKVALRPVMLTTLGVVALGSFLLSLQLTQDNQPFAFFGTTSRAWQLALGGALALSLPLIARLGEVPRAVLGWSGLAAILWACFTITDATPYPGTAALLPTLGAAAVIASGAGGTGVGRESSYGPVVLLGTAPMRWVGRLSYSLYLWHWPMLVFGAVLLGGTLGPWAGLAVVALSFVPAWLSLRYVEDPIRRSTNLVAVPRNAFAVFAVCTLVATLASLLPITTAKADRFVAVDIAGTAVAIDPVSARSDIGLPAQDGCAEGDPANQDIGCRYGPAEAPRSIALVGDSHALQWFPPVGVIADRKGWQLRLMTKSGCSAAEVSIWRIADERLYSECDRWRSLVLDAIDADPPDLVVIASIDNYRVVRDGDVLSESDSADALAEGLRQTFRRIQAAGSEIVVINDNPRSSVSVTECISANAADPATCDFPVTPSAEPERAAAEDVEGVRFVDLNDAICPRGTCPAIANGIVTYRDDDHLTATFAATLAPQLYDAFTAANVPGFGRF